MIYLRVSVHFLSDIARTGGDNFYNRWAVVFTVKTEISVGVRCTCNGTRFNFITILGMRACMCVYVSLCQCIRACITSVWVRGLRPQLARQGSAAQAPAVMQWQTMSFSAHRRFQTKAILKYCTALNVAQYKINKYCYNIYHLWQQ